MNCFIVIGVKGKTAYLWNYVKNEYYELNNTEFNYSLCDVIEVDSNNIKVLNNSSIIRFNPKDSKIIGKTNLKQFFDKMDIIAGRQTTSFEELLNQRNENRRIISLVKFSGSTIKNGQLRIKHQEYYSYCDILDLDLKSNEGREYCGTAIIEYIPDKKKERCFNLIYSIDNDFNNKKHGLSKIKNEKFKIDLQGDDLYSLFSSNTDFYEEIENMSRMEQEAYDKKVEEEFVLLNFGEGQNEESYEDYFDEDILEDTVNAGFDDWVISNEDNSSDHEMDYFFNYEMDYSLNSDANPEDKEDIKMLGPNATINIIDKLLGRFKVYKENNINSRIFATNTSYVNVNLLHPYGLMHIANDLHEVKDLDLDVLTKYNLRANRIIERFKDDIPDLSVPSIIDVNLNEDDEWF